MCKENLYAKMEKLVAQICRCTRQGLSYDLHQNNFKTHQKNFIYPNNLGELRFWVGANTDRMGEKKIHKLPAYGIECNKMESDSYLIFQKRTWRMKILNIYN